MKIKVILPLLAIVTLLVAACNNQSKSVSSASVADGQTDTSRHPGIKAVLVSWELAKQWRADYKKMWKDSLHIKSQPLLYFTVKAPDLLASMGIDTTTIYDKVLKQYPFVRINLGYDAKTHEMKAFIQPVDSVNTAKKFMGRHLFFNQYGDIVDSLGRKPGSKGATNLKANAAADLNVADLNTPCPNTCGE